jgi:hypothetical protein
LGVQVVFQIYCRYVRAPSGESYVIHIPCPVVGSAIDVYFSVTTRHRSRQRLIKQIVLVFLGLLCPR